MRKVLIVFWAYFILLVATPAVAQQTANWYFGSPSPPAVANSGIRIDFSSGSPVIYHGLPIGTKEGSSSISTAAGVPLFYTDGVRVWDASTNTTFGGTMAGGSSSTQSAIVMPKPGATNEWLIFTSGQADGSIITGISYYTVSGSPGSFTLSAGTTLVGNTVGEGLFIIGSTKANSSFWVIARDVGTTGVVRAWEVTNTGAVITPAITSTLSGAGFTNTNYSSYIGTIKSNVCQNRLAFTYLNADVDLVDFNAGTGQVVAGTARRINVPAGSGNVGSYGIEFSNNDAYLYITNLAGFNISRHNLTTNVTTATFATTPSPRDAGQLQTAPDGKIYMGIRGDGFSGVGYIGAITDPGLPTATFNAQELQVTTDASSAQGFSYWGLPTFPKSLIVEEPEIIPDAGSFCTNTAIPLTFTFAGPVNTGTIVWTTTGGGTFSPNNTNQSVSVTYTTTGSKTVTLNFDDNCGRHYTKSITITIDPPKTPVGTITCSSPNLILNNPATDPDEPKYIWYKNSVSPNNVIGVGTPSTYAIGNDGSMPTQICLGVSSTVPTVSSNTNRSIGSSIGSSQSGSTPYTSPTINVLASRIVLKSFKVSYFTNVTADITYTIKQGATTIYTQTQNSVAIPFNTPITIPVNTSLLKGTGYTINVTTNPSGLALLTDAWAGATNVNEITYNAGPGFSVGVRDLIYDFYNYTVDPVCSTPVCYTPACSLPVEWLYLNASRNNSTVAVNWGVAIEQENERFDVQRSADGVHFTTIGSKTGRGNASQAKEYQFIDEHPLNGKSYYRIVQYDFDGKNTTSEVVLINAYDLFDVINIYPNPSSNVFHIDWYAEKSAAYQVVDVRGTLVASGTLDQAKGTETVGEGLPSGVYIVKVFAASQTINLKLIKQ